MGRRAVNGSSILLGLAYKRNSSDARECPALAVAASLAALGAEVVINDDQLLVLVVRMGHRREVHDR